METELNDTKRELLKRFEKIEDIPAVKKLRIKVLGAGKSDFVKCWARRHF